MLLFLTGFQFEGITIEDETATMTVSCSSTLLVRSGPGKNYDKIGSLNDGEQVSVTGRCSNDWYRIDYGGKDGYVSGNYLTAPDSQSSGDAELSQESLPEDENFTVSETNAFLDWLSIQSPSSILKILIPSIIILILLISAFALLRSIRRDKQTDSEDEDDMPMDEFGMESDEANSTFTSVIEKPTPLPDVRRSPVTDQMDPNMLDSRIRNFVVDDVEQYMGDDEETLTEEEAEELARLEQILAEKRAELKNIQKQINKLKKS